MNKRRVRRVFIKDSATLERVAEALAKKYDAAVPVRRFWENSAGGVQETVDVILPNGDMVPDGSGCWREPYLEEVDHPERGVVYYTGTTLVGEYEAVVHRGEHCG